MAKVIKQWSNTWKTSRALMPGSISKVLPGRQEPLNPPIMGFFMDGVMSKYRP